ncbi:hypothetical protein NW070_03390 [Mycoplasmopsis cynos]|nr:hypothetical protein [Mycoplasmopsis cynos]UWV77956.1 hypothetical protein NW070_03390 [Mycoplasmopsis cynos]
MGSKMSQVSNKTSISEVSKIISTAMIYEVRGNSGVILKYRFLKVFQSVVKTRKT